MSIFMGTGAQQKSRESPSALLLYSRRLTQNLLGLQVDDLRFFARAADAGEQHIEKLSSQPRLVHIEGGERGVAVLCLGQVVEPRHHDVARNTLSQQFQGADDADGDGIVGADIALGDLGAGESARQFLCLLYTSPSPRDRG